MRDQAALHAQPQAVPAIPEAAPDDQALPLVPGVGTFFDEGIDLRDGDGTAFLATVLSLYEDANPRKRKRSNIALENHNNRIRHILANAVRTQFYRDNRAVLYFRKADSEWYIGKPPWMKHGALGKAVDGLVSAGLLKAIRGKLMPPWSETPSWASSYAATEKLISIAEQHHICADSIISRVPYDRLVRLYGPKPSPMYDHYAKGLVHARKGKPISFAQTAETIGWSESLKLINACYRGQRIGLGLTPAEQRLWIEARNTDPERRGAAYRQPEVFRDAIYRVFNNGDEARPAFEHGGRLFGAWWMSLPSELRCSITLDGQPTTELDFGECHPRMLYHRRGLDALGDLYRLPEISEYEAATGKEDGEYRNCIKWLTQVLINGKGRPDAAQRPEGVAMPPGLSIAEIVRFIKARHQPIAGDFQTGIGLRLMRLESDIALEIIATAMEEGWVALSVHDSFIAAQPCRERLERLMIDTYRKRFGHAPKIKAA